MKLHARLAQAAFVASHRTFSGWFTAAFVFGLLTIAQAQPGYRVIRHLDGLEPTALIEAKDGNLYGTLATAGHKAEGVVFKLSQDGSVYTVLHHFTALRGGGDGSNPQGLVEGSDGALYGTTKAGGLPGGAALEGVGLSEMGNGTVFRVNKDGSGYRVLLCFTGRDGDGSMPYAGLAEGPDGGLYGTTFEGSREHNGVYGAGQGTVFKLNKDGSGYRILHTFGTNPADGDRPWASLTPGSDGALYGTTDGGGSAGARNGTVFKLNPDGSGYTVLHSFPDRRGDGRMPRSGVVEGRDGTLYGTTTSGGPEDGGTVFNLKKDGSGYRVLHAFTHDGEGGGTPQGLVQAKDGTLYGTTENLGRNRQGAVFKLNRAGKGVTILHNFPAFADDGAHPQGPMIRGRDGAFYGMTGSSTRNSATVFKLIPQPIP